MKLHKLHMVPQAGRQHHCPITAQSACGVHTCALSVGTPYLPCMLTAALFQTLSSLLPCRVNGYTMNKAATLLDDNLYAYLLAHTREAQVRIASLQCHTGNVAQVFSSAALLAIFRHQVPAPPSYALNCLGLQALRELRVETAVAYPEQRKLQVAPEQMRHSPSSMTHHNKKACSLTRYERLLSCEQHEWYNTSACCLVCCGLYAYKAQRAQGALLAWLVETLRVARAVEVGVFTGYSALATALACALSGCANPAWCSPRPDPIWASMRPCLAWVHLR